MRIRSQKREFATMKTETVAVATGTEDSGAIREQPQYPIVRVTLTKGPTSAFDSKALKNSKCSLSTAIVNAGVRASNSTRTSMCAAIGGHSN